MLVAVRKIISQRDFGCIFLGERIDHPAGPDKAVKVVAGSKALLGRPAEGETWEVDGRFVDARLGKQLNAFRCVRRLPTGRLVCDFIAAHAPGIGAARAKRLWAAFGINLSAVLSSEANIATIARVIAPDRPILSLRIAAAVVRAWKDAAEEANLVDWLMTRGIDNLSLVRRIHRILGDDAVKHLNRNPYILVSVLDWRRVDGLGRRLFAEAGAEEPRRDPRRLLGAVDAAVKSIISGGDTAFSGETLHEEVAHKLGVSETSSIVESALDLGRRNDAFVGAGSPFRAPGCASMEEAVVDRLNLLLSSRGPVSVTLAAANVQELLKGAHLHPEQTSAVEKIFSSPVACLQGGAGVGKTHTTRAICDAWQQLGGRVVLCALAGKAALRLSRATGRLAKTLSRLLGELEERRQLESLTESGNPARKKLKFLACIDETTLVIVDEASMVDLSTAYRLLHWTPAGGRILWVGDEFQLPPVSFGLIYHRLVLDEEMTARLSVVHRQTAESGIPAVAASIRRRALPIFAPYRGLADGVSFVSAEPEKLQSEIERIAGELGGFSDGKLLVVTATKKDRDAAISELNARFHDALRLRGVPEVKGHFGQWFSPGEPIIHLRNNYQLGLANGSLGRVCEVFPDARRLTADFDGDFYTFAVETSPDAELDPSRTGMLADIAAAYAITCHRAQGSQAERVIVPIYASRLLDPSWLYTAVTRAERQAVLVGALDELKEALERPWSAEKRIVGFNWTRRAPGANASNGVVV